MSDSPPKPSLGLLDVFYDFGDGDKHLAKRAFLNLGPPTAEESSLQGLPGHLQDKILCLVSPGDLLSLAQVCKDLYEPAKQNHLWEPHLEKWINDMSFSLIRDARKSQRRFIYTLEGAHFIARRRRICGDLEERMLLASDTAGYKRSMYLCLLSTDKILDTHHESLYQKPEKAQTYMEFAFQLSLRTNDLWEQLNLRGTAHERNIYKGLEIPSRPEKEKKHHLHILCKSFVTAAYHICSTIYLELCAKVEQDASLDIWPELQSRFERVKYFFWLLGKQPFCKEYVKDWIKEYVDDKKANYHQPELVEVLVVAFRSQVLLGPQLREKLATTAKDESNVLHDNQPGRIPAITADEKRTFLSKFKVADYPAKNLVRKKFMKTYDLYFE